MFQMDKTVKAAKLWKAVKAGGFTPVRVQTKDGEYKGPNR